MSKTAAKLCKECSTGNLKKVKKLHKGSLFSKSIPVDSISNEKKSTTNGMTPLMCASMYGRINIVEYLVSNGADVNARNAGGGNTPLMYAAAYGRLYVCEYLIAAGADVNACNTVSENTPLMYAAAYNYSEIVKLLLKNNADKEMKNKDQLDALQLADRHNYEDIVSLLRNAQTAPSPSGKPAVLRETETFTEELQLNKTTEKYLLQLRLLLGGARAWGTLHGNPLIKEYPQYKKVREIGKFAHEENGHEGLNLIMGHIRSDGSDLHKYLELLWNNLQNEEGEKIWTQQ